MLWVFKDKGHMQKIKTRYSIKRDTRQINIMFSFGSLLLHDGGASGSLVFILLEKYPERDVWTGGGN